MQTNLLGAFVKTRGGKSGNVVAVLPANGGFGMALVVREQAGTFFDCHSGEIESSRMPDATQGRHQREEPGEVKEGDRPKDMKK